MCEFVRNNTMHKKAKNGVKSFKLNFLMNTIFMVFSFIFLLITVLSASHFLCTGKVLFSISIIAYFALLAQLGILTYGMALSCF